MKLKIKLPTNNKKFEWFEIKMIVSNKIEKLLNKGANKISFKTKNEKKDLKLILPKAPIIKKEVLSNGYEIFKLIKPFEIQIKTQQIEKLEEEKVLATVSKAYKEKLKNSLKN